MANLAYGERITRTARLRVGCSAVILDAVGEGILLTRRIDNGLWCLPSGGLDPGETAEECCMREVFEETGLLVRVGRLTGVYSDPHMAVTYPDGNMWHLVAFNFMAVKTGGEPHPTAEVSELGYFTPAEIENMNLMEHHRLRISDALAGRAEAFIR